MALSYLRYLRHLDAVILVADSTTSLMVAGNGDVIAPEDGVMAVGSGGAALSVSLVSFFLPFDTMGEREVEERRGDEGRKRREGKEKKKGEEESSLGSLMLLLRPLSLHCLLSFLRHVCAECCACADRY